MFSRIRGVLKETALPTSPKTQRDRKTAANGSAAGRRRSTGGQKAQAVMTAMKLIHTAMKTQAKMALLSLIVMDRWPMAKVCQIAAKP
jgi:hypothetical protein